MSRKRKLKKQRKRRALWIGQLEDLYLRRENEAFLEAARPHLRKLDEAALSSSYREVVDQVLASALSVGDPDRIGKLLERIHRGDTPSPTVLLAEAVFLLAEGQLEQAADRLAALDESGETVPGVAGRIPEMLGELARPPGETKTTSSDDDTWTEISDYIRLSRALEAHALPDPEGKGPPSLPRSFELTDPRARSIWDFYRALAAVGGRGFRPGAKTLAKLTRASEALRAVGEIPPQLERLRQQTQMRVDVIIALHSLEQKLRRRRSDTGLEHLLLNRLDTIPGLSGKLLHDPPPALLRPLQQALRTRWRSLLELIFERRGEGGLGTLLATRPELVATELNAGATGAAEAKLWAEVQDLLEYEEFGELATLLSSAAARAATPGRVATLWTLELWSRREEVLRIGPGEEAHEALVRLIRMATGISARFDAPDRPPVARSLRADLIGLCQVHYFCGHFLEAAEALLEHLPDDARLLAIAIAAAANSQSDRSRREHAARIAARGPAPDDLSDLMTVVENLASEPPATALPALTALRPLFSDADWPEVIDNVAAEASFELLGGLLRADGIDSEDPNEADWIRGQVRRDIDLYRPFLGEHREIAALEVIADSLTSEPSAARHLRRFLSRFPELEAALVIYRHTIDLRNAGVCLDLVEPIVDAVIDRLDARVGLWMRYLSSMVDGLTPKQLRRLRRKSRKISRDETLDDSKREVLRELVEALDEFQRDRAQESILGASLKHLGLPHGTGPAKPRERRSRPVDDRQLDLFTPE